MSKILPLVLMLGAFASPVAAHSMLKATEPADGATVPPPQTLTLNFSHNVRLVSARVTGDDIDDITLPVDRAGQATDTFALALPVLAPRTYTVRWTAAADDGHVMKGKFAFTVTTGAAKAPR